MPPLKLSDLTDHELEFLKLIRQTLADDPELHQVDVELARRAAEAK
jgi:hypothetical protein